MSATPARRRAPEQRHDDLLEAAGRLLVAQGAAATTVDEIAAAAGVAKGTFYLYFASKDSVVDALRTKFMDEVARELDSIALSADEPGWHARTDELVRRAIDFQVAHAGMHRLVVETLHGHGGRHIEGLHRVHGALRRIIEAGASEGAYRVADTGATAWLLLDLLHAAGERAAGPESERVTLATIEAVGRVLGLTASG